MSSPTNTNAATRPAAPHTTGRMPNNTFDKTIGAASNKPIIDQATAIGSEVSKAERLRRVNVGCCSFCASPLHQYVGSCPHWHHHNEAQQRTALGIHARGFEKNRRRENGLCLFCGGKHLRKDCCKEAHAEAERIAARVDNKKDAEKAARTRAWKEKERLEAMKKKE